MTNNTDREQHHAFSDTDGTLTKKDPCSPLPVQPTG
jgi:hypothetical protein